MKSLNHQQLHMGPDFINMYILVLKEAEVRGLSWSLWLYLKEM